GFEDHSRHRQGAANVAEDRRLGGVPVSGMIVDSHTHAWARWPYKPAVPDEATKGAVEHLIHEMDQNGVAEAVIVSARIEKNPQNNEYGAAAVRRYPTRLHQFADVDCIWSPEYHTPGASERLRQAADTLPI